jgi:hypothetical protein
VLIAVVPLGFFRKALQGPPETTLTPIQPPSK